MGKVGPLVLIMWLAVSVPVRSDSARLSRIYVTAVPCSRDSEQGSTDTIVPPSVTLYDQARPAEDNEIVPGVTTTQIGKGKSIFISTRYRVFTKPL